ncbi:MAG: hypothetical protein IAE94_06960 [Chthoniobacterales bacterium]|nr:hypothetical protein [Chthoniobacterales bacterium]
MKNTKGLIGLATFVLSLWAVVVVTYAKQVAPGGAKLDRLIPLQQSSCSSSSSSSSSGE